MQSCVQNIPDSTRRLFVAFSGGLDSSVLLHLLVSGKLTYPIIPWHINHGLQDAAEQMEGFCLAQASKYNLECRVDRLEMQANQSNLEATARHQRYAIFEQELGAQDCIVTAHHADDQVETFLLNAFRGSGSAGLRGIARAKDLGKGKLIRPLLDFSRDDLVQYASQHQLEWCDDPSNDSARFDRNYLRQSVIPAIKQRWPQFCRSLSTVTDIQVETQGLLEDLATIDYSNSVRSAAGMSFLDLATMQGLTPARQKNLIRQWVNIQNYAALPAARLLELTRQLSAGTDSKVQISMPAYSIRMYDKGLYLVPQSEAPLLQVEYQFKHSELITIDAIDSSWSRNQVFELLGIGDHGQHLSLKFSEIDKADKHRLKRLFQKYRIPPWKRASTPIVYLDGKLVGLLQ